MTWLQRYRLHHFLQFSFWVAPVGCLAVAVIVRWIVLWLDQRTGWSWLDFTADGARDVLGGLSSSMLTFITFSLSALLLLVQLASGQLTSRIIALTLSARRVKASIGVFAFTYSFTLSALGCIDGQHVPQLLVFVTILSNLLSIAVFFWFVQRVGTSLRPIAVLQSLWEAGRAVIDSVYPHSLNATNRLHSQTKIAALPASSRIIEHVGNSGTFLAFGIRELVAAAQTAECVIELLPQVGDFVARNDPLFRVYPADSNIDEAALHHMVAFGVERTMEQDPAFAFRIMVDIAARALSPAVNDPTTAVLALDQLHRLLRYVSQKQLDSGRVFDRGGQLRLLYSTPQWEDFVMLAVSEIRLFGANSLQVPRRLQAMLEHLMAVLPEARIPALRQELTLLHSAVEHAYLEAEDRRRAEISDRQGIGGSSLPRNSSELHLDETRNQG
jgi:uncharacterized membrane protein